MSTTDRRHLFIVFALLLSSVGLSFADHKLEPKHFDHVMYAAHQQKGVTDGALALDCDENFASVDPGGFVSLDIGHRRHFKSGTGPDLTVFTRGGVSFEAFVAKIENLREWVSIGESAETTGEFEVPPDGDYQYLRVKNRAMTELKVDCAIVHYLIDHPTAPHPDHHGR